MLGLSGEELVTINIFTLIDPATEGDFLSLVGAAVANARAEFPPNRACPVSGTLKYMTVFLSAFARYERCAYECFEW
jgi:hypothetical protein